MKKIPQKRSAIPKPALSAKYPPHREQGMRLGEEEQLGLVAMAEEKGASNYFDTSHRYRKNGAPEKVLGAVYTPPRVASALTRWAVRSSGDAVLDPSCGEGVFLSAVRTRLSDLGARKPQCVGVDIEPETAAKAGAVCSDFFAWASTAPQQDVIVGNPPFIRSHLFPESSRTIAFAIMTRMGFRPSRLMSTWSPFLAICCGLLKPTGRLAMVIPEELLAVSYAEELRAFLLTHFRRVVVCFPDANIFPEVQQAVVLLLCDNTKGGQTGLFTIGYSDLEEGNYDATQAAQPWTWNSKWSHLFLSASERLCVDHWWSKIGWKPISEYGRVEVGIVTGDNEFFILRPRDAARFPEHNLVPIITSARAMQGIRFDSDDFRQVVAEDRPAYLLNLQQPRSMLAPVVRDYLEIGERQKVSQRFKCRVREPWYAVPSVWQPDAILLRQAGDMARLIHLAKKCAATDTIHRVTWKQPSRGRRHAASFMNTWTLLASEITGRSYGGGVLELMPGEANKLPVPEPVEALDGIFDDVDEKVRSRDMFAAVAAVDNLVLPTQMPKCDKSLLRETLDKLIQRRKSKSD
jgi:adenine-specific DNA-methyltransferase